VSAPRTALITGAGGFVGSTLAEGFAALGWRVTAVDRAFDDLTRRRLRGMDLVAADLSTGVPADMPAAGLIVHAAAMTTDPADLGWTRAAHLAANTRPLLAMLEHAARTTPDAFVFLSSSGVFAAADGGDRLRETDHATGDSPYAVAKRAGETLVLGAFAGNTAAHVLRLGYLFGPHETRRPSRTRVSLVAQWLDAARHGRPLAVSADDPLRDWTYAPDLAPALARLAGAAAATGPRHLGSPYVLRDSAMAAMVARHVPGAACVTEPATRVVKPPMAASDIPALQGFAWTAPDAALARLAAAEVAA
jgi:UDP-glucose 4-epimerase